MGVISVGASLGVRTSHTNVPTPVSVSTSSTSILRSSTSSTSTPVSSTALNNRKKSSRKRLTSVGTKKRSISANHNANSIRNERSIPLSTDTVTSTNTPASVTSRTVAPSVSMAINCKKPIGRLVYVRTTMEPARLAPHVIGANGDKLNAIMSRARCNISYRNTQSFDEDKDKTVADKNKTDANQMDFAMAFLISANTMKRVDDGVLLLQAVVESTEQQLRKYQGRGKREEKEKKRHVVIGEREGTLQEECHAQIQQERSFETDTSRHRSRSCGALGEETMTLERQRHPKRRRNGDSATSGVTKRGRSAEHCEEQVARSDRQLTRDENEEDREDTEAVGAAKRAEDERRLRDEREAFRIRMARTVMISRRIEAEAKRARAQEVLERDKYFRLRRQFEEMEHRKKVAELVVKKQCNAMAASLSISSSSKKKQHLLGMERLHVAHDACSLATSRLHVSDLRARDGKTYRIHAGKPRLSGLSYIGSGSAEDGDLVCLAKKVQAFGKMITSGSIELPTTEDSGVQLDAGHGEVVNTFDFPNDDADECMDMDVSNADEVVVDVSMETLAEDSEVRDEEKSGSRRDSFRSTWDLPGLTRDLNLIQDYSLETDCKLLRFLAGERQYFYLESLAVDSSYSREVERWLLTPHDIHILRRYLLERADIGKEIVLCAERLRALGNLVPPLSFLSNDNSLTSELGVFESSRHKEWSALQNKIVTLHSLALVAHMLGRHYLARQVGVGRSNINSNVTGTSHDNLLEEDTLKSDLFTYILRPIRSSAIESSLFDSLPISLVRETIEQCPEVVNHVLQWKSKDDVPEYLHEINPCDAQVGDVASTAIGQQVHPSSSYFLRNLLLRLTIYMRDLDAIIKALVSTLKEKRRGRRKGNGNPTSRRHQRFIAHVNRLKSVTAHVVVENTKLQLHKWWILFAENSCAWFDPDSVDEMDDRSYDKFTCLQDALYIWHNEALLYTTKDDFVDPERLKESAHNQTEDTTADGAYNAAAVSYPYAAMSRDTGRTSIPRDEEVAALIRLTPVSLRDEVQNRPLTVEEAEQCIMTPRDVENARAELEESLASTRDLMNELGRSGPWRTHVQHSNSLKCELAKQLAIREKLVKHQWARYYTKYQEFAPPQTQDASSDQEDEEKAPSENADSQPQGEPTAESGSDAASLAIDWTGVFDPDKDAPDIIEMKKLRHEITLAKDQLLRDISRDGKNGCGVTLQSSVLNGDQKALVEECKGLAASCTQALGKFLGMEETCETTMAPVQKKHTRSTTKAIRPGKRPIAAAKADRAARTSTRRQTHGSKKVSARALGSGLGSRSRRSESIRVAKTLAASNADFLLPLARSSGSRTSSSRAMSVRSIGSSCDQRSEGSPPLRMGCSGCRDLRRRCTGCSGCCLHCVCVSCGCRMCCSSRLSAVQKTMTQMLDVIEANETCKWMSNASAGSEGHHCGMLFFCQRCHSCEDHCPCLLTGSASEPAAGSTTAARPTADATFNSTDSKSEFIASHNANLRGTASSEFSRRQRRFRINPVAAQRRGPNVPMDDTADNEESASAHRDSNDPSENHGSAPTHGGRGPLPTFDYGIDDAFGLGPMAQPGQCRTWRPAPSDKNEQEDLFRAARVRMKLVRSAHAKTMGLSSSSGCLDGEQLWQPERIRMMWERRDFHGVLGLPRDATVQQIKRQYRKLALKLHPDKASDASASLESTVAEAGRNVGAGNSGERVDAFVAATHSYKILLGDVDAIHARAWAG